MPVPAAPPLPRPGCLGPLAAPVPRSRSRLSSRTTCSICSSCTSFLRRVSPNSASPPLGEAHPGSTVPAGPCSPFVPPAGKDLAARDSGRSLQLGSSDSSRLAPWFFGPSLGRHDPPSSLLRPLLTSPSLSPRRSPQVRRCIFPFKPPGSTAHVFGWSSGLTLASTLTARGRPHCQFVFPRTKVCSPLRSASPRGYALRFPAVPSIGPGWLLAANKIQPMLRTRTAGGQSAAGNWKQPPAPAFTRHVVPREKKASHGAFLADPAAQ